MNEIKSYGFDCIILKKSKAKNINKIRSNGKGKGFGLTKQFATFLFII